MYLSSSAACSHLSSASPISRAAIVAQNRRIARAGQHFSRGNRAIDSIMAALTPPVASPSCGDLKTSAGIVAGSPFPRGGGPAPTVEIMSPAQLQAWYESWAASSRASAAGATYGAIEMPIVGGPSPGVSARGVSGYSGRGRGLAGLGDLPASTYTPGAQFECTDPVVLPVDTVDRPASGSVTRVVTVQGAAAAAGWPWGLIALLAGAVVLAAATSDGKPAPAERAGR